MDQAVSEALCQLCASHPAIQKSHVLPAFVFRAIRSDSPTGFFRNPNNPNHRMQDGDKVALLCSNCEQRFCAAEGEFANNVFSAFHATDQDHFTYGPWLHYFITSLAWRTLVLDLPGLESDVANPRKAVAELAAAAETMRRYLLGAKNLAGQLRNHAILWTRTSSGSAELAAAGPNVAIRRSVFGYSILDRQQGYSGILHNLAGFICVLIVKGNPRDTWNGTKVNPAGGEIKQPQRISSWLMREFMSHIIEFARKRSAISEIQRQKVIEAMHGNSASPALRFRELDERLVVDPQPAGPQGEETRHACSFQPVEPASIPHPAHQ